MSPSMILNLFLNIGRFELAILINYILISKKVKLFTSRCFVVGYVYTKIILPNENSKVFPKKTAGWTVTP